MMIEAKNARRTSTFVVCDVAVSCGKIVDRWGWRLEWCGWKNVLQFGVGLNLAAPRIGFVFFGVGVRYGRQVYTIEKDLHSLMLEKDEQSGKLKTVEKEEQRDE